MNLGSRPPDHDEFDELLRRLTQLRSMAFNLKLVNLGLSLHDEVRDL